LQEGYLAEGVPELLHHILLEKKRTFSTFTCLGAAPHCPTDCQKGLRRGLAEMGGGKAQQWLLGVIRFGRQIGFSVDPEVDPELLKTFMEQRQLQNCA
jgi:hypothetical protein